MYHLANGTDNESSSNYTAHQKASKMPFPEPNPLDKLNWLIHLQHVRGEGVQCKELINSEIKKSGGKNEFAYYKQGIILREEGRIQDALDSFQTCMKLNSKNAANIKEVGKCLYEMRRYRLSLEAYLEAEKVAVCPDWQIYYNIGQCFMRLGEISKAREYAQKAIQLGKHESAFSLYIKILVSQGELKSAISICNLAIESCPDSVSLLNEAGLLCLKTGQTQHAFEKLSSALALDPISAKALLGIGCITQSHNEPDVALTKYKVAVSYEPNSVALWNNIGLCFYEKQKYIAAISCLKRALWICPTNWRVLFNLGLVHFATYQPASAFNFLCAAVNLRPDFAHSFIGLGCALFELNDIENSARAFGQALLLSHDDPLVVIDNLILSTQMKQKKEVNELMEKFNSLVQQNIPISKEILVFANKLQSYATTKTEISQSESSSSKENEHIATFENVSSGELQPDEV